MPMNSANARGALRRAGTFAMVFSLLLASVGVIAPAPVRAAAATWNETTTADFADGTFASTAPAAVGNGAVGLATTGGGTLFSDDFSGSAAGWTPLDGTWSTTGGEYQYVSGVSNYNASMITGIADNHFSIESRQKVTTAGLSVMGYVWGIQSPTPANQGWKNSAYMVQWNDNQLRIFRWTNGGLTLVGAASVAAPAIGTWYDIRLVVDGTNFEVFIDGVSRLTASDATYGAGGIGVLGYEIHLTRYDDVVVSSLVSTYAASGTYTSNVFDAGSTVDWTSMSWTAAAPAGTSVDLSYRTGDTAAPDVSWTTFTPVPTSGSVLAGSSRYVQYRSTLATTNSAVSPTLADVSVAYETAATDTTPPTITDRSPAAAATGVPITANITATFSEPIDPATVTGSSFHVRAQGAGTDVPAAVSVSGSIATLNPTADLDPSTVYDVTVAATVADLAGNALGTADTWSFTTAVPLCTPGANEIVLENCLPGSPPAEWQVSGTGDTNIQGFATNMSVNHGTTVSFKIDTDSDDYRLDIYRMGYYDGMGARKVATVQPSATLPQIQPACLNDAATGLVDCGNWAVVRVLGGPVQRRVGHLLRKARPRRRRRRREPCRLHRARRHRARRTCCSRPPTRPGRRTTRTAATASTPARPPVAPTRSATTARSPRAAARPGTGSSTPSTRWSAGSSRTATTSATSPASTRIAWAPSSSSTRCSCPSATTSTGRPASAPTSRRPAPRA